MSAFACCFRTQRNPPLWRAAFARPSRSPSRGAGILIFRTPPDVIAMLATQSAVSAYHRRASIISDGSREARTSPARRHPVTGAAEAALTSNCPNRIVYPAESPTIRIFGPSRKPWWPPTPSACFRDPRWPHVASGGRRRQDRHFIEPLEPIRPVCSICWASGSRTRKRAAECWSIIQRGYTDFDAGRHVLARRRQALRSRSREARCGVRRTALAPSAFLLGEQINIS